MSFLASGNLARNRDRIERRLRLRGMICLARRKAFDRVEANTRASDV
jgi:hypothetical protein